MPTTAPIGLPPTTSQPIGTLTGPDGKVAKANNAMDKDSFLKLLVAQLKYQTPDNPTDSSQFMAQSAQFSMLEAMQNMAKEQTSLLTAQRSLEATSMLGQKITALGATGVGDITGVVTGVKLGASGPILKVGNMEVPLSSVKEVAAA